MGKALQDKCVARNEEEEEDGDGDEKIWKYEKWSIFLALRFR